MLDQFTDEPALLIGHSLGAQIATFCAHREPQRLAGAILIDPVFNQALTGTSRRLYRLRHLLSAMVWLLRVINAAGLHRRRYPPRDLEALDNEVRQLLARGEVREFVRRYSSPWPNLRHVPIAVYLQDILATLQPLPPFAGIHIPLLAILARSPTFADPAVARRIVTSNPDARLSAINANHWPLTEAPEATRSTIDQWCMEQFG
jgi:pimeloyl-ACP methyl ester carboxylesterase